MSRFDYPATVIQFDNIVNIIEREETNEPEPTMVLIREDNRKYCPHNHLNIFVHHRFVKCKDCGATLDAFEALRTLAQEENNMISEIKYLFYELKHRKEEKEKLEKEIKNLKAQKRKII